MPLSDQSKFLIAEAILFVFIIIPTLYALIWGAPFVPTPLARVRTMLKLANIKKGEKVYDLGCGDGRLVHLASREHGANAIGFELSPFIYMYAKICQPFWRSKAKIKFKNFYSQNISDADVIVCYLMPETLKRFQTELKKLRKGTRVISYAFRIPDLKLIHSEPKVPEKNLSPIWVYEI
ncbi:MAG: hypothetical protein ACD_51C00280G0010 [uncultured bacterium]|nr:MAG: hypothetical protein ACD_51C00280G0010 [uncultured bacterium]OGJ47557.1 MAG: hypothetical protein A2244_00625 [Candidatus Peregrinibacteria bacterium RIFOXYA2_FULL_41_18]OGJ49642.1 MAG: hypothetical protein A2344_02485 [Candidatus Peregrinibacteria bacterium RIFOXYB12_FULL_41_12]OGJ53089.1 MAG: hypothetical protein A2448_04750 [Candidatus Peregrinibacteria bacterium RIFOXYC2_FULL_41_22]OGJ53901.1 MAG: hypothetical protein A2336_00610 [Candidatus Peregrinibacteria bacterium RIFOXYB2_FULL